MFTIYAIDPTNSISTHTYSSYEQMCDAWDFFESKNFDVFDNADQQHTAWLRFNNINKRVR